MFPAVSPLRVFSSVSLVPGFPFVPYVKTRYVLCAAILLKGASFMPERKRGGKRRDD